MANLSVEPNDRVTFKVVHEDEHVIIVDKPSGLASQPGLGHLTDTLLNGLFARHGLKMQNLGATRDFGLLHRLDKDASGLVAAALSIPAWEGVRAAFEKREVKKLYYAICAGAPKRPTGVIDRPIVESQGDMLTAKISSRGKVARTAYRVLAANDSFSFVEARTLTGRLHQVRVHLASIGCAIVGDRIYAKPHAASLCRRLALHAHSLSFQHPVTAMPVRADSPLPKDLRALCKRVGIEWDQRAHSDSTLES